MERAGRHLGRTLRRRSRQEALIPLCGRLHVVCVLPAQAGGGRKPSTPLGTDDREWNCGSPTGRLQVCVTCGLAVEHSHSKTESAEAHFHPAIS